MSVDFDVAVIGGGPGGYIAAIRAAQLGMKTVCIDDWKIDGKPALGGTCTNVGCIPSKALLEASAHYEMAKDGLSSFGVDVIGVDMDIPRMQMRRASIIRQNNDGIAFLFRKNKITYFNGTGSFAGVENGEYTIAVTGDEARKFSCTHVIVATGSKPRAWPNLPFDEERVLSNTGVLSLNDVPKSFAIIGAGVVGLEMGSVWRRLGSDVTLFESQPELLAGADRQVAMEAQKQLTRQGLTILTGATVRKVRRMPKGVAIEYDDARGQVEKAVFDKLLVSIGRVPHTQGLGVEKVGLKLDERGFVAVDGLCRTNLKNVWAIGDVVRGPMLAHKAEDEGAAVAERIAGKYGHVDYKGIPWVVYTHPEIAWAGRTEEELVTENVSFKKGVFPFMANGRARTMGTTEGFVKILADAKTDEVLGVHMIGPMVSELIAEAVMAMTFKATSEDIARICHAHPTLSEAVKEAALAVDGRALNL